ncbi:hypothetical protein MNBD_ALPHA09-68 [hydrothermal vent metagenome]|uniref:histidine kinase n=1 Tax=hydrothermal vent metagenome TaxID=652676 RepID=A0A3B0T7G1_9ZZZZ
MSGPENISAHLKPSPAQERTSQPIREARAKLATLSTGPATFKYEMLDLFATNHTAAALALPIFATVLGSAVLLWMDWPFVAFWLAAIFVTQGVMVGQCERFSRLEMRDVNVAHWGRRFTVVEFVSGCAWAMLPIFAWEPGNTVSHVLIFAITLAMIAVRVTLASQALAIVYAGTLPLVSVLILRLSMETDILHSILALIAVTAEFYFVWLAQRLNSTTMQMIHLRAQKDGLIADLEDAKTLAEDAQRRAESANIAKSRFLATMSHELRTPLNAILGFSDIMRNEIFGAHNVPNYKEYSTDIHSSGEHLLNLINEILDLSRIEAGRYDLDETLVSVAAIGEDCQKLLAIRARARGITLRSRFDAGLPKVWADERAVRQIWLNLISNAVKFTPPGGEVYLDAIATEAAGLAFCVTDTGPGIPEEEIPLILSSFGQGAQASRQSEDGAGLGLPIVKGLAELHGGRLVVESVLRQGTRMTVIFPAARLLGPPTRTGDGHLTNHGTGAPSLAKSA